MGAINLELLLELQPALIMGQQFFDGDATFQPVQDAGLPVVLNSDFADTSPLGQAEWGKYIALYFNTEALANAAYDAVVSRYRDLQSLTAALPDAERPTVITASPYAGTWYMPAGESTVAQLIADAGGNFLFADLAGTSVPLDFETVLDRGADADFWVNVNQFWGSTADMLADDPRYETFSAFQNDRLWNNNLRQNANGGNDYFESGAANPDLLLADLIAIFHPDLLPDHEFTYYQPLTAAD
jgi:iron complex transport system substrate-binding protein